MSKMRILVIATATVVVLGSSADVAGAKSITSPRCKADPAASIAALPAGATFVGSGCYRTSGIQITKPVTISGGTYNDPVTLGAAAPVHPVFQVNEASGVTIENVTINGRNTDGGHHGVPLVGEEGISVIASSDVTLDGDVINDTFGDGLYLGFTPRQPPDTNIAVNGYTVTNAGRQGVTIGYVNGATLDGVTVNSAADAGVDFESDGSPTSGNITFNDLNVDEGGVWLQEGLSGPVAFNQANIATHVVDRGAAAVSGQLVTFTGGSLTINRVIHGIPPAGIWINGPGSLSFTDMPIYRVANPTDVTGLAWDVEDGGHLVLNHCPITTPLGLADSSSTVVLRRSGSVRTG
jgi:hypothetical protein